VLDYLIKYNKINIMNPINTPKKILLIDVSHMFFRAYYAFPRNLRDENGEPINAIFGVAQILLTAIERHKPDYIFGAKDLGKKTIRSDKMPEYKGHRPEIDDDLRVQIPRVYEMLMSWGMPIYSVENYEADDVIASISEIYNGDKNFKIEILTGDADAFQLISENISVLKPTKGENLEFTRDILFEKKGLYPEEIIDFKGMAGDTSDNLKGVAGVGEKGAVSFIREYGDLDKIYKAVESGLVKGAKQKKMIAGKEDAYFTRDMARLYRDLNIEDYDLDDGYLNDFTIDIACMYFNEELGSNTLQKRIKEIFNYKEDDIEVVEEEQNSLF